MKKEKEEADEELERLRKLVKEIASVPDIRDFWIADSGDNIVVCHNGLHDLFPEAIPEMKEKLNRSGNIPKASISDLMFREKLLQYKGYTILYGFAANGWQLIFFLSKEAYLSLAMLEMESCLRRMDEVLIGITS